MVFQKETHCGVLRPGASGGCSLRQLVIPFRFCSFLLLAAVLCWAPLKSSAQSTLFARGYNVIPQPQKAELKGGDFEIASGWRLELGKGVKANDVAVESLKEGLETRHGVTLETRGRGKAIALEIQPGSVAIGEAADKNKAALEEQGCKLELAASGIRITANASTGLFY